MARWKRWAAAVAAGLAVAAVLGAAAVPGKDDYRIANGRLKRGSTEHTVRAFALPGLAAQGSDADAVAPALVRVCEVGGNTVFTDLPGLSADGTAMAPAALEALSALAVRCKDQRMALVVRVLGGSADAAWRAEAIKTAARACKAERRALYWIDGPDAAELARQFKRRSGGLLVAAPDNGDLRIVAASADQGPLDVCFGAIPPGGLTGKHFVLSGEEASYAALDAALINPAAQQPWTPGNGLLSEAERAEGFVALFNGRDFDGWWVWKEGASNPFKVNEKGEIQFRMTGGEAIMTRDRYGDFVLRLEYKIDTGGNSGVFLRAPRAGRQSYIGMEFQLHGDAKAPVSDDMTGALYKQLAPLTNASRTPGEWNELEIDCRGSRLKATLNGTVVQDTDLAQHPELKHRLRRGFIGLQDHHNPVSFRNVRIKPL